MTFMESNVNSKMISLCACMTGVVLGTVGSNDAQAASARVCDAYARQYAKEASRQGQVIGGGVIGSLIGLGIGAATGGAAAGAAIGGGVGIIGGGASRRQTADRMYSAAYRDCMAGKVK